MNNWTTGVYALTPAFISHTHHIAVCETTSQRLIALVGPINSPHNAELAHFIASAPEMYYALANTLMYFNQEGITQEQVISAINKALPSVSQEFLNELPHERGEQ